MPINPTLISSVTSYISWIITYQLNRLFGSFSDETTSVNYLFINLLLSSVVERSQWWNYLWSFVLHLPKLCLEGIVWLNWWVHVYELHDTHLHPIIQGFFFIIIIWIKMLANEKMCKEDFFREQLVARNMKCLLAQINLFYRSLLLKPHIHSLFSNTCLQACDWVRSRTFLLRHLFPTNVIIFPCGWWMHTKTVLLTRRKTTRPN